MSTILGMGFEVTSVNGEFASIEEELGILADIGADYAEISLTSIDLIAGGRIIPDRRARLKACTKAFDLKYTVHGLVSSNFMDPDTCGYQLDAAKALVQLCDDIGSGILVQHGGSLRANQLAERGDADRREREALAELADFAKGYGVRIALENIFTGEAGQYRQTPSQLADTVRAVDHPNLMALIDFSHAYIEATYRGLDFYAEIAAMAPVTGHLHVHDSFGRPQRFFKPYFPAENTALGIGDLHMPLGWGDIDWQRIFTEFTFLPDTVLLMEIDRRYRAEQPQSLAIARDMKALYESRNTSA
ncbi:TIM barrel protein [Devosia sp. WQ 349]|uniref:TIM barrel protein n=1 Tax=Devosia sp. WQ 349K1 TaxID=2800329 RepID=UPI001903B8AF|nr:TIM barrel protein [Devosia sp. WQ 349K1]MBK1794171.1 TIM barrel protein [Devosia sp. WQ 349K1]